MMESSNEIHVQIDDIKCAKLNWPKLLKAKQYGHITNLFKSRSLLSV